MPGSPHCVKLSFFLIQSYSDCGPVRITRPEQVLSGYYVYIYIYIPAVPALVGCPGGLSLSGGLTPCRHKAIFRAGTYSRI